MKDSGIPWIGQIPEHWEVMRLRRVFSEAHEKTTNESGQLLTLSQYTGISPKSGDKRVGMFEAESTVGYNIVHAGQFVMNIMLAWNGSYGVSDFDGIISPAYVVFNFNFKCCKKYFHYLLRLDGYPPAFKTVSRGIIESRLRLYPIYFYQFLTIVPPLSEQEAIANYLDKKCGEIDELIEVEQQMISDLEAYRQSVITEAVTKGLKQDANLKQSSIRGIANLPENWDEVNLLKVIYLRARLGWRGLKADEYVDEGYPFLSAFNIVNNQLIWDNLNFINQQRYDESPEIKLSLHDILIVKDGAGIGKCARVENMPLGESTVNSSLGVITVSETLYYSFLYYFFLSTPFQDNVLFLKNGMGVPHLTQENLKSVRIPLPPIKEQITIVNFLDSKCSEIDGLIKIKQEKIETLKQYRQSLIFETVTGKTSIIENV
ncbi:MAG: restriction endonuclease subunit S [Muribaculaceae bacterium]|nr:restriction endonuclease subunit S [Muribaculaceae bacterium]